MRPPRRPPALDPDAFIGYATVRVADAFQRRFRTALAPLSLTPRQFSVLVLLAQAPGISAGRLARGVLVTPQSMTHLLNSMLEARLIERDQDAGRGLPMGVHLTAQGMAALQRGSAVTAQVERDATAVLSANERAQLLALLHRLLNEPGTT